MADTADYAAMNYGELLKTKLAFTGAVGLQINPLLEKKRLDEMAKITHIYMTAMNAYDATRSEILTCLEAEGMKETRMFTHTPDADDQTATMDPEAVRGNESPSGYPYLLLPAPKNADVSDFNETARDDEANQKDVTTSSPEEDMSQVVVHEHQDEKMHIPETDSTEVISAQETQNPKSNGALVLKKKEQALAEKAIEESKTMKIYYDGVDFNAPHYLKHRFTFKKNGSIDSWGTRAGNNLCKKDLEAFRAAAEKYEGPFFNNKVLVSTDEYLVTYDGGNTVFVYRYYFPEESDIPEDKSGERSTVTREELYDIKKSNNLMKRAIKKAKELSALGESEVSVPFYDRYKFDHHGCSRLDLIGDRARYYEDVSKLKDIMPAFETYARLCGDEYRVLTKDNCIAAMGGSIIYVVLCNIPTQEKNISTQEQKRGRKAKKTAPAAKEIESAAVTSTSSTQTVDDLILKAVDLTRNLPLTNGTDANSTYYLQSSFSVTNEGALIYSGKPFSSNVSLNGLDRCRLQHEKYARTMKASKIVSTDEYTAFVSNDGKAITVFDYNAKSINLAC
jgi:hypothetical protein